MIQAYLKEYLTQNKFEPLPKITKRPNRCKSYIRNIDVFCICRWNYDESDPK